MSSAITRALNELIEFRFEPEILKLAFLPKTNSTRDYVAVSLSDSILRKVIRPRVIVDTNLHGGKVVNVDLTGVPYTQIDMTSVLFKIPMERTNFMSIINVLSVSYVPHQLTSVGYVYPNSYMGTYQNTGAAMNIGTRIAQAVSDQAFPSTAEVELLDNNSVLIRDPRHITGAYVLRCLVGNDSAMTNLSPRAYDIFTDMCEQAVRSYIYRKMRVRLDKTALENGQEFSIIKEIIDSYSDAETMYQDMKKKWSNISKITDRSAHQQFIRMQISPGL